MEFLLVAMALYGVGGVAAFVCSHSPRVATACGVGGAVAGALLGLVPTWRVLAGGRAESLRLTWDAAHGPFCIAIDALSAFFLAPVLILAALAAVYGAGYLAGSAHQRRLGAQWLFFNLFVAGMVLVLAARTTLLFLVAWELMSLAAYFLVTFEHEQAEVRSAGWVYLIATHLGVAFLFLAFLLLGRLASSTEFVAFRALPDMAAGWAGLIFVLAVIGFGAKAGFVPFHVWLPEAHPAAPSHVSALMSGVMIKMGLYGLLRVLTFLGPPQLWWGPVLGVLGLVTALVGIGLALHQRDVKRVLAYSSIENIGLIGLALGVGLWGTANGLPQIAVLGGLAALLHTWNHALMKSLMFLAAGSVVHATGTKDMEKLGGLLRRLPWTGTLMIVGAAALAALPPLNGFVGKWLLYLGLAKIGFAGGSAGLVGLLGVGLLALVGGLAAITYVRLAGIALLGAPRSPEAEHAHEASGWLLGPMAILAGGCILLALAADPLTSLLLGPLESVIGAPAVASVPAWEANNVPLRNLGEIHALTWLVVAAAAGLLFALTKRAARQATWGCGYVQPTTRMQYTGCSFTEMLAEQLLPRLLRPRTRRQAPQGLFPEPGVFASDSPDPVSRSVYEPFFRQWANRFTRLRILQQGKVNIYLIYIMVVVVLGLSWVSLRSWWGSW